MHEACAVFSLLVHALYTLKVKQIFVQLPYKTLCLSISTTATRYFPEEMTF